MASRSSTGAARRVYLMQHGEALPKETDPARPLSERGRADAAHMGQWLRAAGVAPARIVHSGKLRAEQTAQIVAAALAVKSLAAISGMAPDDDAGGFAAGLEQWAGDTLAVGHLPFMDRLATFLLSGGDAGGATAFLPGSIACLAREDEAWRLQWFLRPDLLQVPDK